MTQVARKIVVVNTDAMLNDKLFRSMKFAPKSKVTAMLESIEAVAVERRNFEATVQRRSADGSLYVGQSNDIKHVEALRGNEAVARMFVALKVDPRSYIFPQSQPTGKSSTETSNLKAYKKAREVAELIWTGASTIENVCKVFSVCAFRAVTMSGADVLKRQFAETFLSSVEFRTIREASEDLWNAIDEVRAKHMTTGAQTQASQMIRTLVALRSAEDVRDGREKNVRVHADGLVLQALMRRFGQVTDTAEQVEAEQPQD